MIVTVNGVVIDYSGPIPLTLNNPQFTDEISNSLQFTVSDESVVNRKAFGFINRTDIADNKTKEFDCTIECGLYMLNGTLVVNYSNSGFTCYFKASGDFYTQAKTSKLSELLYDTVSFQDNTEAQAYIDACIDDPDTKHYVFPKVMNRKAFEKFPVKFNATNFINDFTTHAIIDANSPTIPFPYLHYIYKNIFRQLGFDIKSDVFQSHAFLRKLCIVSNFMLNEYSIDTEVLLDSPYFIKSIASGKDPEVVTIFPHNLVNYQFVQIGYPGISMNSLNNKIFQANVVDTHTFKLIGADTSSMVKFEPQNYISATISKIGNNTIQLTFVGDVNSELAAEFQLLSDDYEGNVAALFIDEHTINVITTDSDYGTHNYSNARLYEKTIQNVAEGALVYLPVTLGNEVKAINPENHLPDITIKEFISEIQKYLGIVPFISDASKNVDIKLIDDILSDPDFIDITRFATKVKNIDNPGVDGYLIQSKVDGADDNMKNMLPVTTIADKYIVKPSVASLVSLPINDNTNDVRLVRDENAYYVFSKAFLNAEYNWKLLCFNLLDALTGAGGFKIETNCSTVLPDKTDKKWTGFGNNCMSKSFPDVDTKINLRLAIYHGLLDRVTYQVPWCSHDIYDETGNVIDGAEFACRWDTIYGIINKLRSRELNMQVYRRKDFKYVIIWPVKYLINFKFFKKYRIDGVDNLVKSIKLNLNQDNTITFNETELVRV